MFDADGDLALIDLRELVLEREKGRERERGENLAKIGRKVAKRT